MKRLIYEQLKNWKNDLLRKPLILMGARQVGKTYILQKFAATEYENYVYINFEDTPSLKILFDNNLNPEEIIKILSIETKIDIKPEKTLIIFDEVQECPNALNSLKYFYETAKEYHICAAGSLLGVKLSHVKGFPVGKVNFLNLYPLCFLEFLQAIDESKLVTLIKSIQKIEPLPEFIHEKLLNYYKIYLYVGGMPAAVNAYLNSKDFTLVRKIQDEILRAYSLDFAKHAPTEILMKITQIWDSIPSQLAKENKKFIYSIIRKGARAKDFENALQWLTEAGLIYRVFDISIPKIPLNAYAQFDFFKIYLLDIGLLGAMAQLSDRAIIYGNQLFQEFRGALVENFAAQELVRQNYGLYYWASTGTAELDFIVQHKDNVYPLEIKSGNSSRKKSMQVYAEKFKPNLLIRCSTLNLKKDGNFINLPLYLIGEINQLIDSDKLKN